MKDEENTPNKKGVMHIGKAIHKLLESYRMQSKFDEVSLISSWDKIVGRSIAKRTKKVFIRDETLFVEMESPALKHDLSLLKGQILDAIHSEFGKQAVRKIVLLLLILVPNWPAYVLNG